jgi:hypothetical protein
MGRNRVLARLGKVLVVAGMSAILVSSSWAEGKEKSAKEKTLHNFTFKRDGGFPFAGLSFDAKGNLYGASYFAGAPDEGICCGAVFQLTPDKNNWKFNVIYSFTGGVTDGETPSGSVVFDSSGNLYGTTQQGDSITDSYGKRGVEGNHPSRLQSGSDLGGLRRRCSALAGVESFSKSRRKLCGFGFSAALTEAFDQEIEHGDEKQIQNRAHDHAAEYRCSYRVTSVFSSAGGNDQRDNAQNEC